MAGTVQVQCLKALRKIEAGVPLPEKHANYTPVSTGKLTLLNRDPKKLLGQKDPKEVSGNEATPENGDPNATEDDTTSDPYKQGLEDCVIITMKGISAGMQNTG